MLRVAVLFGILILVGCSAAGRYFSEGYTVSPLTDDLEINAANGVTLFQPTTYNDCQNHPTPVDDTLLKVDCYYLEHGFPPPIHIRSFKFVWNPQAAAPVVQTASTDKKARDALKDVLLQRSDAICTATKSQIAATNDWINFGLGENTTILGGIGAIVTAATPARVLSGLAGISNASRSQVNETFYQNAVKVAIMQKIDELRAKKYDDINKLSSKDTTVYSVQDMLTDVADYHNRCSFSVAVENLGTNTPKVEIPTVAAQIKPVRDALSAVKQANPQNPQNPPPQSQSEPMARIPQIRVVARPDRP